MIVSAGNCAAFNMTAFESVHLSKEEEDLYRVRICYRDIDGKPARADLHFKNYEPACAAKDDLLKQVKEVEMERISTHLENALNKAGTKDAG